MERIHKEAEGENSGANQNDKLANCGSDKANKNCPAKTTVYRSKNSYYIQEGETTEYSIARVNVGENRVRANEISFERMILYNIYTLVYMYM